MVHRFKKQIISILPNRVLDKLFFAMGRIRFQKIKSKYLSVKKTFEASTPNAEKLPIEDLRKLHSQFPNHPEYGYSPDILDQRGQERAGQLTALTHHKSSYLELGCWDGMVTYHLQKLGKTATGIDARDIGFDQRALKAGTDLRKMDAAALAIPDHTFDVVFSYDSFEHFSDPTAVLSEIYRVTKPGGYIFLEFGPLFDSPMGLHAYRQINVPYCQHLFTNETLSDFLAQQNAEPLDFTHCNGWSLEQFRELFDAYSDRLDKVVYAEHFDYAQLDMVQKYAPIIKSKTAHFDGLLCDSIKVLFRKR